MPGTEYTMAGFILAVCGSDREQHADQIPGIHRRERIVKLEDFAVASDHDSMGAGSAELRELAAKLTADTVHIPPGVTHKDFEDWSVGQGPKLWTD